MTAAKQFGTRLVGRCATNRNSTQTYRLTLIYAPLWRSSRHSNVISNWKGLKNAVGLSKTVTFVICTLAILHTTVPFRGKFPKVSLYAHAQKVEGWDRDIRKIYKVIIT